MLPVLSDWIPLENRRTVGPGCTPPLPLAGFIGAGLGAGDAAIIIATPEHREAIELRLQEQDLDVKAIQSRRRLVFLDARETLSRFMRGGFPDESLFREVIGRQIAGLLSGRRGLRAFGEMVALLRSEGKGEAAIRLEELWNRLFASHSFSLLCAYPMNGFPGADNSGPFAQICMQHSRVIPGESYAAPGRTREEQLRLVALLQQKAASLAEEIAVRKQAEELLQRSQNQLVAYLETASIGLHWIGPDGIILWANDADFKTLGYAREEYVGHHIAEFHADRNVIEDILARLQRDEKLRNYEARLKCKDGSTRTVLIDSSVLWEEGRFVHTQCFTRDITDLKETEEQLRQAQKMEAVGHLAGGIAHDFNNLLTAINGYSEIACNMVDSNSPLKEFLEEIKKSSEHAASLTQQLLAYSRKQIRTPVALNLNHAVLEVGKMLRRLIGEQIEVEFNLSPELGMIKADLGQIQQIILNLALNARDAMPHGGRLALETANAVLGKDGIAARFEAAPGPYAMLAVKDDGTGMNEEVKARIFEPYFTTKEVCKGTQGFAERPAEVAGILRLARTALHFGDEPHLEGTGRLRVLARRPIPHGAGRQGQQEGEQQPGGMPVGMPLWPGGGEPYASYDLAKRR